MNVMNQADKFPGKSPEESLRAALMEMIHQADRSGANALIDSWATDHGYEHIFIEILEPVLLKIGEEWTYSESITLAQAYIAAKIAEDVLKKIADQIKPTVAEQPEKGPVIFGNIEDDFHSLGRRMVVTFLRINGWNVIDLGNDVEPREFVETAIKAGARIIGVSAMTLTTAMNIKRLRAEIDSRGLSGRVQLAVGGAVFLVCPNLVQDVGGDGTAANAMKAVTMCDQLWKQSLHFEEGKNE
jgi:methanogenic corrinoid protein MtbC1